MEPLKKLVVRGTQEKNEDGVITYYIASSNRDSSEKHVIDLEKQDPVVEVTLDDGTVWMVDSTSMHEVFSEVDPAVPSDLNRGGDPTEFEIPSTISAPSGGDRSIIGKIAVKLLKVFAKKGVEHGIGKLARKFEDSALLNNIPDDSPLWDKLDKDEFLDHGAAVFRVNEDFEYDLFTDKRASKPYFLFIHGTNSDTFGAFEDLKNTDAWSAIHKKYGRNVIAFQHRTLTESPLTNVAKLVEMLPDKAELHMITHSRGGLVGDILNRYSSSSDEDKKVVGFNDQHLALLEEEGDDNDEVTNRADDIANIKHLNKVFEKKEINVTKYIRVACPGAGTKLASKRLDVVLNVFGNLIGATTVGSVFKELLSVAVQTKDNVDVLPGLESMNPDSPFLKVLNDPSDHLAIDGSPLAVVSGNSQVSLTGRGLLVILGKLFFWQRNDLVVNTDSMYLGAKRDGDIQYFFDEGNEVNHVKYFENNQTVKAIHLAILTEIGKPIPGFNAIKQYEVPASDRALLEHGELYPPNTPPSGDKPIAIILPGIMGSNLEKEDRELWLHYGRILKGGLTDLAYAPSNKIEARSVVKTSYNKLFEHLSAQYDVTVFPFDWRKPLTESADELNAKIADLLNNYQQPIKLIGHSMGGVLVRDFILKHPATWQELNKRKGFRLLFLGSPLGGSHRILTVLFGEDAIIKKLSKLDLFHSKRRLLEMFSKFPGILGLLPLTTGEGEDYAKPETWEAMLDVFGKKRWPLPSTKDLDNFRKYRDNVLKKRDDIDYSNMVYIAGKDKMTPKGYYLDTNPKEHLYFLYTAEGDQSVTWELGIPKQLKEKDAVYYTRVSHGALANEPDIFKGIDEILEKGETDLLRKTPPIAVGERGIRGEIRTFRTEPDEDFDISSNGLRNTLFGDSNFSKVEVTRAPLSVTVSRGDLRYAAYPLLAGHFINDAVLYAEAAIDGYLDGKLSHKHELGLYPGEIGTNALFKPIKANDFNGAIIVGMGEPDNLTSVELAKSVEQAVLNYILSLKDKEKQQKEIGLSALVMACGYGGLSVETSIKAIVGGINGANNKISAIDDANYPIIGKLEFVERYANRALNCMYVLKDIIRSENKTYQTEIKTYNIVLGDKKIKDLYGLQKRIPLDSQSSWWNRISVKYIEGRTYTENGKDIEEMDRMIFNASTRDSRVEENELYTSTPLIDQFIDEISIRNRWSQDTAKALFELLIPNPQKERLKKKGHISWILDEKSASYPWELLQDNSVDAKPLCINAGMIRQLRTTDYRQTIKRAPQRRALIVADPELNGYVNQLPGAKKEGFSVEESLGKFNYPATTLIGRDAATITKNFFSKDYSIIHLAGHGEYNPHNPQKSG
ncbi:MAG: CHAT domain-containing protein, partial [Bacteroidota bacterium]